MLRFESETRGSDAFYREVINVLYSWKKITKNPAAKIQDMKKRVIVSLCLAAGLMIITGLMIAFLGADVLTVIAMTVAILTTMVAAFILVQINNMMKKLKSMPEKTVLTLDDDGVQTEMGPDQTVRIKWSNVSLVRVFDECIAFFPKDEHAGTVIIFTLKKYAEEITGFLNKEHSEITIVQ